MPARPAPVCPSETSFLFIITALRKPREEVFNFHSTRVWRPFLKERENPPDRLSKHFLASVFLRSIVSGTSIWIRSLFFVGWLTLLGSVSSREISTCQKNGSLRFVASKVSAFVMVRL